MCLVCPMRTHEPIMENLSTLSRIYRTFLLRWPMAHLKKEQRDCKRDFGKSGAGCKIKAGLNDELPEEHQHVVHSAPKSLERDKQVLKKGRAEHRPSASNTLAEPEINVLNTVKSQNLRLMPIEVHQVRQSHLYGFCYKNKNSSYAFFCVRFSKNNSKNVWPQSYQMTYSPHLYKKASFPPFQYS